MATPPTKSLTEVSCTACWVYAKATVSLEWPVASTIGPHCTVGQDILPYVNWLILGSQLSQSRVPDRHLGFNYGWRGRWLKVYLLDGIRLQGPTGIASCALRRKHPDLLALAPSICAHTFGCLCRPTTLVSPGLPPLKN